MYRRNPVSRRFFMLPLTDNSKVSRLQKGGLAFRLSKLAGSTIVICLAASSTLLASRTPKDAPRQAEGLLLRGTLEYLPDPENPTNNLRTFTRSFEWFMASNCFTGELIG